MKKRIIVFTVTVCTLVLALFSTINVRQDVQGQIQQAKDTIICDFEEIVPDFSLLHLGGGFWKITRSTEYVKNGKYSAKVVPGGYYDASTPYFTVPLTSKKYGFSYQLKNYSAITVNVYNPQSFEVDMTMGLIFDGIGKNVPANYTLTPGWNYITYVINHNIIMMFSGSLEGINSIYFQFETCASRNIEDSNVFYFDDVGLKVSAKEIETVDIVKLDKYEIANFERPYQQYVMGYDVYQAIPPEYSIVDVREKQMEEGVFPTSGNCCLKIQTFRRTDGYQAYPKIIITNFVTAKAVNALTAEEKEKAYISFDIYAINSAFSFDLGFRDAVNGAMSSLEPTSVLFWGKSCAMGKWTTISVKLTDIDDTSKSNRHVANPCFVDNPYSIYITYPDYFTGVDKAFYLDNVRIEFKD